MEKAGYGASLIIGGVHRRSGLSGEPARDGQEHPQELRMAHRADSREPVADRQRAAAGKAAPAAWRRQKETACPGREP